MIKSVHNERNEGLSVRILVCPVRKLGITTHAQVSGITNIEKGHVLGSTWCEQLVTSTMCARAS